MSKGTRTRPSTTKVFATPTSLWKGTSFLSLDPSINNTGYAHFKIADNAEQSLSLLRCGIFSPGADDEPLRRAAEVANSVLALIRESKPSFIFLERPPDTIYHQGRLSPSMLIARAQSVFKVIGVTYSIFVRVQELPNMTVFPIEPVDWQERSIKKRNGLDIKTWSLMMANNIINLCSRLTPDLHTGRDENIADAIVMGYLAYQHGLANQ